MNFDRCKTCGVFGDLDRHRCEPAWVCALYFDELDHKVHACDFAEAAEKYVDERYADLDYPRQAEVWVRRADSNETPRLFEVSVEMTPVFHATEQRPRPSFLNPNP